MTNPRILVTGATGKTGRIVAAELLKAGYPVRAMVHREDARTAEHVASALKNVQRAVPATARLTTPSRGAERALRWRPFWQWAISSQEPAAGHLTQSSLAVTPVRSAGLARRGTRSR